MQIESSIEAERNKSQMKNRTFAKGVCFVVVFVLSVLVSFISGFPRFRASAIQKMFGGLTFDEDFYDYLKFGRAVSGATDFSHPHDPNALFVFEVTRHGARAPFINDPLALAGFKVPIEMLTAQGMRQRMLLGMSNQRRYLSGKSSVAEYSSLCNLCSGQSNTKPMYVESTNVYRTIQSAYSELHGFFRGVACCSEARTPNKNRVPFKVRRNPDGG